MPRDVSPTSEWQVYSAAYNFQGASSDSSTLHNPAISLSIPSARHYRTTAVSFWTIQQRAYGLAAAFTLLINDTSISGCGAETRSLRSCAQAQRSCTAMFAACRASSGVKYGSHTCQSTRLALEGDRHPVVSSCRSLLVHRELLRGGHEHGEKFPGEDSLPACG
jgi:hypothetical protein